MLDLGQVRCFVAAATELNFRRAAALLNMTQPPLSRQIQLLEDHLGVQLFERVGRTVKLTPAGNAFLADATRLLDLSEQAESTVKRASKGKTGRVRLGFTGAAGYELVPGLLVAAARWLPEIEIILFELGSAAQIDAFAANTIDLGFMRPLPSRQALASALVEEEPMIVALPTHHPLCRFEEIAIRQLDRQPFVMPSPTHGKYFYNRIAEVFGPHRVTPDIVQYIDQTPTIVSLVRAGLGLSIVPASAQRFHFDNVTFRPIVEATPLAEMSMVWRTDHDHPTVTAFREMAAAHFGLPALA
jgi:DNA-binding transcriptional LysR family regulator